MGMGERPWGVGVVSPGTSKVASRLQGVPCGCRIRGNHSEETEQGRLGVDDP